MSKSFLYVEEDMEPIESMYLKYSESLVHYAESFLFDRQSAEDVVQNLFLSFWDNPSSLNIQTSVKAYLFQAIKNRCLNKLQRLKIQDRHQLLFIEASINAEESEETIDEDLLLKVKEVIDQMPDKMREVFQLKYFEGKKIRDISQSMSISETTVKTHLKRGKERIIQHLAGCVALILILIKSISEKNL